MNEDLTVTIVWANGDIAACYRPFDVADWKEVLNSTNDFIYCRLTLKSEREILVPFPEKCLDLTKIYIAETPHCGNLVSFVGVRAENPSDILLSIASHYFWAENGFCSHYEMPFNPPVDQTRFNKPATEKAAIDFFNFRHHDQRLRAPKPPENRGDKRPGFKPFLIAKNEN